MKLFILMLSLSSIIKCSPVKRVYSPCVEASICVHNNDGKNICGLQAQNNEVRLFSDTCDLKEFNCEYGTTFILIFCVLASAHGPPHERDNEDISMGRKMGAKWCSMAKVCNHDRVPICGISHAGDVMGFRDLCDMFDYNCIRRRNYKQTACPEDKSMLTVSRRPTNIYYDD